MTLSLSRPVFRVLALDGGGMRGLYTAVLLQRLAAHFAASPEEGSGPPDLGKAFDLIVGTSTGAILAAALAAGRPLERVVALYRDAGPLIFPSPSPMGARNLAWCLRHWRRPSANVAALRRALSGEMGSETFGELHARRGISLCLTATDLNTLHQRLFRTPSAAGEEDAQAGLVEACMASCAAPILFPPLAGPARALGRGEMLCDGGLWAGNPVLLALLLALETAGPTQDIQVLSAGTSAGVGAPQRSAPPRTVGIGYWIRGLRLMQASLDAHAVASTDLTRRIAAHLSRPVQVVRLLDAGIEAGEDLAMRLDNATPAALSRMEMLAAQAARANIEASEEPVGALTLLREIFADALRSETWHQTWRKADN